MGSVPETVPQTTVMMAPLALKLVCFEPLVVVAVDIVCVSPRVPSTFPLCRSHDVPLNNDCRESPMISFAVLLTASAPEVSIWRVHMMEEESKAPIKTGFSAALVPITWPEGYMP